MKIYADNKDITVTVGNLAWQNTIAELATTMTFSIAKVDMPHTSVYLPTEGSIISMVTNVEVFRGIVLTIDDGSDLSNNYTVCDFGFYLNKSKETYQFNQISVNRLLSQVCSDFGIGIDSICDISYTVTKIFLDKTVSEIIKEVLTETGLHTGYSYNFDVTPLGLRVYRLGDFKAYPEFRVSPNTPRTYSVPYRGNVSHSTSIEDMKNSVKIVTGDEKGFSVKATARDEQLISEYGLLQEVEKIDDDKTSGASEMASQRLKELSTNKETFSFEIIEEMDSYTRAGMEIDVDGVMFIIEGSDHSVKNGVHIVNLGLRRAMT